MALEDDIATIRLIIADLDDSAEGQLFTDVELEKFLTLSSGSVRLAAADALEAIASSELLVSKKIRTQDLQTDGPAVAAELRRMAATQRDLYRQEDDSWDGFDVVSTVGVRQRPEHTNYFGTDEFWGL